VKKYNSKIGLGILLIVISAILIPLPFMIYNSLWSSVLADLLSLLFIAIIFLNTYYIIDGDKLIVKSSFLINIKILIVDITKIEQTRNIISSPALSLDRIEVFYEKTSVIISPRNKVEFIDELLKINAKIEVVLKKYK